MFIKCCVKDIHGTILEWVSNSDTISHFYTSISPEEHFFKFITPANTTEVAFDSKERANLFYNSLIKILEGENEVIEKDMYLKRIDFKTDSQRQEEKMKQIRAEQLSKEVSMRIRASQEEVDNSIYP